MVAARGRWHRAAGVVAVSVALLTLTGVTACGTIGRHRAAGSHSGRLQNGYETAIHRLLPSLVEINSGASSGAGVVFDGQGDIVTSAEVVGTAREFTVAAATVSTIMKATLVAVFAPDDLAVIRVSSGYSALKAARWADSSQAQAGQIVLAMGSPDGLLGSITQGIVSATGRTVTAPALAKGEPPAVITGAIQTSAAINSGNNGGALVTVDGGVLGIPALAARDPAPGAAGPGIGFAIPANTVTDIAAQLIAHGKVITPGRSSLQVTGRTQIDSTGKPDGVIVDEPLPGGAAAQAGIQAGDVIVGLDRQQTLTLAQLANQLTRYRPDQKITVEILRGGNPKQLNVTLAALPN